MAHFLLHGQELSTIPLSLRTIFYQQSYLQDLFNRLFVLTFLVCRLIYGTIISLLFFRAMPLFFQIASNAHDRISIVFCIMQGALCVGTNLLNFYWALIILRKVRDTIYIPRQHTIVKSQQKRNKVT
jgi:hypothetical protein